MKNSETLQNCKSEIKKEKEAKKKKVVEKKKCTEDLKLIEIDPENWYPTLISDHFRNHGCRFDSIKIVFDSDTEEFIVLIDNYNQAREQDERLVSRFESLEQAQSFALHVINLINYDNVDILIGLDW